jgi:hypothetical protein
MKWIIFFPLPMTMEGDVVAWKEGIYPILFIFLKEDQATTEGQVKIGGTD